MNLFSLNYNALLLFTYVICLTLALVCCALFKNRAYLWSALLFLFFIADEMILFAVGNVEWVGKAYDQIFLSFPTVKTLIYVGIFVSYIGILRETFRNSFHARTLYCLLTVMFLIMLFIPVLPDSNLKLFLYYLPGNLYMFILVLYALLQASRIPAQDLTPFIRRFKIMLKGLLIFVVLTTVEDAFMLLVQDAYFSADPEHRFRNWAEDLASLYMCGYAIYFFVYRLTHFNDAQHASDDNASGDHASDNDTSGEYTSDHHTSAENETGFNQENHVLSEANALDYKKFYCFCGNYHITPREQDVLKLLLDNKNNNEICERLSISIGTAKTHVHNIFAKLEVSRRNELITFYANYVPPENP